MSDNLDLIRELSLPTTSKIVLVVLDGLGGLPSLKTGKTELETAKKPNLDRLASRGMCGLVDPVAPGITPGSAPGHLALFGYDPLKFKVGRGVLEAMGIDFELGPGDVAARGNFCTVDEAGRVTDRRAGRISTEKCAELARLLDGLLIEGVKVLVRPVKEHRFVAVFRGEGLDHRLGDSDPQQTGVTPKTVTALSTQAGRTADIANQFVVQAKKALAGHHPANMVLLRGFSGRPELPTVREMYKLKSAAISGYPMYRGLARLVGMEVIETGPSVREEFLTLKQNYGSYDFFFVHVKGADAAGEDGDFERKVRVIEEVDDSMPLITSVNPDVVVVTGDHSTPARLKGHSWHPVPVLLYGRYCRPDRVKGFSESAAVSGGLGRIAATSIMPLAMANALKLTKYGA